MKEFLNNNKILLFLLVLIFIITESIDLYLDKLFGTIILHSILQIILFLFLFMISFYLFGKIHKNKIKVLLPEDLIKILEIIRDAENKNIVLNQNKFLSILKVTKPTMKKKIERLINLKYISIEEKGNYKYLKLTNEGKSILK